MKKKIREWFFGIRIRFHAKRILKRLIGQEKYGKDKQGGWLTVMDETREYKQWLIGKIPEEMSDKCKNYSVEKTDRTRIYGHISSWQTRKEILQHWGGGIRAGKYFIAFSNLPELGDESLVVVLALKLKLLTINQARIIIGISNNAVARRLARNFGFRV